MKNYQQSDDLITIACSDPATPASGDPVRIGAFCGVAVGDERTDGTTVVRVRGVVRIPVRGHDGGANSPVAVGDKLFYLDANTPKVSKNIAGTFFGYALGTVPAGQTANIDVLLAHY